MTFSSTATARRRIGSTTERAEIIVTMEGEVLIGQVPAQTVNQDTDEVGAIGGVAIGDATAVVPTGPRPALGVGNKERYIGASQRGLTG